MQVTAQVHQSTMHDLLHAITNYCFMLIVYLWVSHILYKDLFSISVKKTRKWRRKTRHAQRLIGVNGQTAQLTVEKVSECAQDILLINQASKSVHMSPLLRKNPALKTYVITKLIRYICYFSYPTEFQLFWVILKKISKISFHLSFTLLFYTQLLKGSISRGFKKKKKWTESATKLDIWIWTHIILYLLILLEFTYVLFFLSQDWSYVPNNWMERMESL